MFQKKTQHAHNDSSGDPFFSHLLFSLGKEKGRGRRFSKLATYWKWNWQTALLLRGGWKYQLTVSDSEMKFWYIFKSILEGGMVNSKLGRNNLKKKIILLVPTCPPSFHHIDIHTMNYFSPIKLWTKKAMSVCLAHHFTSSYWRTRKLVWYLTVI